MSFAHILLLHVFPLSDIPVCRGNPAFVAYSGMIRRYLCWASKPATCNTFIPRFPAWVSLKLALWMHPWADWTGYQGPNHGYMIVIGAGLPAQCGVIWSGAFKGANLGTPPATVGVKSWQILSPIYRGAGPLSPVDSNSFWMNLVNVHTFRDITEL